MCRARVESLRCAVHRTRGSPWYRPGELATGRGLADVRIVAGISRTAAVTQRATGNGGREVQMSSQGLPTRECSSGNAVRSCRRELIPSFVNTLPRCHSTVFALMNSCAADLRVREPVAGEPGDLLLLRGELRRGSRGCVCEPSRRLPSARGGRARRTPPSRSRRTSREAVRSCSRASTRRPSRRSHSP